MIKNEPYAYKSGKVYVRFENISADVAVHLNAGSEVGNAKGVIVVNNTRAAVDYTYSAD